MNYDHQSAGDHIGSQLGRASINKPMMDHSIGQISSGIASAKLGETPGAMENLTRLLNDLNVIEKKSIELAERIGGRDDAEGRMDAAGTEALTLTNLSAMLLRIAGDVNYRLDRCLRNL